MRLGVTAAVLLGGVFLGGAVAGAQTYAAATIDRSFSIEWSVATGPRGARLEGYVTSSSAYVADQMQLLVEHLDGAGQVAGRTTTWVAGGVPARGRAYFDVRVPAAAGYRVQVLGFEWIGRGQ